MGGPDFPLPVVGNLLESVHDYSATLKIEDVWLLSQAVAHLLLQVWICWQNWSSW
jgi:hypothetical protein